MNHKHFLPILVIVVIALLIAILLFGNAVPAGASGYGFATKPEACHTYHVHGHQDRSTNGFDAEFCGVGQTADEQAVSPTETLMPTDVVTTPTISTTVTVTDVPTDIPTSTPPVVTEVPPTVVVPPVTETPVVTPEPKDNCNNGAGNGDDCTPGNSSGSNQGQGQQTGDQTNQGEQGNSHPKPTKTPKK